ncbi:hypothetical protein ACQPZA_22590 [Pseudonocardia xinjiangensis]|uniref:hypothetical protein n=1 Tax=Pseudonocardia xinjiangensis TaxID=75289 RepID=UPI003D93338D
MSSSPTRTRCSAEPARRPAAGARQWLAAATTLAQRAERTMLAVAAEVDAGTDLTARDGSRLHLNLTEVVGDRRAALDRMLDLHGASGLRTSSSLQRFWRDVSVAGRHPLLNPYLRVTTTGRGDHARQECQAGTSEGRRAPP